MTDGGLCAILKPATREHTDVWDSEQLLHQWSGDMTPCQVLTHGAISFLVSGVSLLVSANIASVGNCHQLRGDLS